MFDGMGMEFYKMWYRGDVSPNVNSEDKEEILKQISEISLMQPITINGIEIEHEKVPKLAKFSNTTNFSGLQLYVVMTEIFSELRA